MYLKTVSLTQYRNYITQKLELHRGINLFIGKNGQGKTNFLEAIYFLSCGDTFRKNKNEELIRWNQDYFRLEGILCKKRDISLEVYIDREKRRQIKINGVKYKRSMELLGYLQVVLFSPEDLEIVKGSPSARRRYMDLALCQNDRTYAVLLHDYQHILLQRNALLKHDRAFVQQQLSVWDDRLVEYGVKIILMRLEFLKKLVPTTRKIHYQLTNETEKINITYQSSLGKLSDFDEKSIKELFWRKLRENRSLEIQRKMSLFGPHRDDLIFYLNDMPLRIYGSQGQQRSCVLALKIGEIDTVYQKSGFYPLLLLDDVMSELDDLRRDYLLELIDQKNIQTIITAANLEVLNKKILKQGYFLVEEGNIIKKYEKTEMN